MKIFLKDEFGKITEVSKYTSLLFVEDDKNYYDGIECGINNSVDKNKIYINSMDILKIIPRASNVILISQEKE